MSRRFLHITLTVLWLILIGLLVRRDLLIPSLDDRESRLITRARQEQYYGIWSGSRRIGYIRENLAPGSDSGFQLSQEGVLALRFLGQVRTMRLRLEAALNPNMELEKFDLDIGAAPYRLRARGKYETGRLTYTLDTGQGVINDSLALERRPRLDLNRRPWLLSMREVGEKRRLPIFDPMTLRTRQAVITYHGETRKLIRGRVHRLRAYSEEFAGIRTRFFLDDRGKVIRAESAAGFVLLAEPRFQATDITTSGQDLERRAAAGLLPQQWPSMERLHDAGTGDRQSQ